MTTTRTRHGKLLKLTQLSMLIALEAIVCFTPLGSLPAIGPIVATLSALPVIVASLTLGIGGGSFIGFMFGLFSFLVWTFTPPSPLAFAFTPFYSLGEISGNALSLVICFVPRILIGTVTGLIAKALSKTKTPAKAAYAIAGAAGSLVNTILVLGGIYVFFGEEFASANGMAYELILGVLGMTVLTSGIPEAVLGGAVGTMCDPLKKAMLKLQKN